MFPSEYRTEVNGQETRVMGLSSSEDLMIVGGIVVAWYRTLTDGRTESTMAKTALCIASYADALSIMTTATFDFGIRNWFHIATHLVLLLVGGKLFNKSLRIGIKFGTIVLQINTHRPMESVSDMTSYFQDGGRDVNLCRKVLPPDESTCSVCLSGAYCIHQLPTSNSVYSSWCIVHSDLFFNWPTVPVRSGRKKWTFLEMPFSSDNQHQSTKCYIHYSLIKCQKIIHQ